MAKKVPFDDPQVLTYVRIAYVTTQVIVLGAYYYTGLQVRPPHHRMLSDSTLTRATGRSRRRTTRRCSSMVRTISYLQGLKVEAERELRPAVEPNPMVRVPLACFARK